MNKKTIITQEEYSQIEQMSLTAKELLEDERFKFLRDYLNNGLTSAEEKVLNNTIREYQDVVPLSEKLTRIFKTTKKVQVDELAGQYKWIKQFFADLNYMANLKDQYDEGIESGLVVFEPGVGKDVTE